MSLAIGEIKTEATGFAPGSAVLPFCARTYLSASFDGMRFAYGSTEAEAETNLMAAIDVVAEVETEESE